MREKDRCMESFLFGRHVRVENYIIRSFLAVLYYASVFPTFSQLLNGTYRVLLRKHSPLNSKEMENELSSAGLSLFFIFGVSLLLRLHLLLLLHLHLHLHLFFFFDFWFSLSPLLICAFLVHTIPSLSLRCVDCFLVVSRWAGGRVVDDAMLSIPRPPSLLSFRFGFF